MFVDDDNIINHRETEKERKDKSDSKAKSKDIKDSDRESEKVDYINERGRYDSIISIKSDRSCKRDNIKNFKNIVYISVRGSLCSETPARITND